MVFSHSSASKHCTELPSRRTGGQPAKNMPYWEIISRCGASQRERTDLDPSRPVFFLPPTTFFENERSRNPSPLGISKNTLASQRMTVSKSETLLTSILGSSSKTSKSLSKVDFTARPLNASCSPTRSRIVSSGVSPLGRCLIFESMSSNSLIPS